MLFLGAGIILGGVWANQSWGRYWGWDPKETWALISLLVYLVIIHGRFAGWLKRFGTNVAAVIGLNMVIMTYYGVNYFLVGLHSYAGGTAFHVPVWVYLFLVAEVVFVLLAYFGGAPSRRRTGNRPLRRAPGDRRGRRLRGPWGAIRRSTPPPDQKATRGAPTSASLFGALASHVDRTADSRRTRNQRGARESAPLCGVTASASTQPNALRGRDKAQRSLAGWIGDTRQTRRSRASVEACGLER